VLTPAENDFLTRVEGDAPAGRMLRRYWFPVLLAEELAERGSNPLRVRLLGENLIAYRDRDGALALIDAPSLPDERPRVQINHPVREAGGLIWTYIGTPELEPPFPAYDWTALPREQLVTWRFVQQCNWLQVVEGGLDSGHTIVLHQGFDEKAMSTEEAARRSISSDPSPRFEAEDTAYGMRFAMIRKPNADPERSKYVKTTTFAFPSTAFFSRPVSNSGVPTAVQIFVPIDDDRTMHYTVWFSLNGETLDQEKIRRDLCVQPGVHLDDEFQPYACEANWWRQDRALMKRGDWTGIAGFPLQDVACQESMGTIVDRSREHLGTSDIPIIRFRRRLAESIQRVLAGGDPVGLDVAIDYARLKTEQRIIGIDEPWQSVGAFAGEFV
jgi:phthalate 4,5-dioxygenase oxygenase subunit